MLPTTADFKLVFAAADNLILHSNNSRRLLSNGMFQRFGDEVLIGDSDYGEIAVQVHLTSLDA